MIEFCPSKIKNSIDEKKIMKRIMKRDRRDDAHDVTVRTKGRDKKKKKKTTKKNYCNVILSEIWYCRSFPPRIKKKN